MIKAMPSPATFICTQTVNQPASLRIISIGSWQLKRRKLWLNSDLCLPSTPALLHNPKGEFIIWKNHSTGRNLLLRDSSRPQDTLPFSLLHLYFSFLCAKASLLSAKLNPHPCLIFAGIPLRIVLESCR